MRGEERGREGVRGGEWRDREGVGLREGERGRRVREGKRGGKGQRVEGL